MLVMSRKKNESLVLNNDIVISVVEIRADKVRLGIVVPKDMPVHRQEVYDAIMGSGIAPPIPTEISSPSSALPHAQSGTGKITMAKTDQSDWFGRIAEAIHRQTGVVIDRKVIVDAVLDATRLEAS
jgi:carbon storage regulator